GEAVSILPGLQAPVDRLGAVGLTQIPAEILVAEQLGEAGEDLQVLVREVGGHDEREQQVDRLAVESVEVDALRELDQGAARFAALLDASMRQGHAVAETGAAQPFPADQLAENDRSRRVAGDQNFAQHLQRTLLATDVG